MGLGIGAITVVVPMYQSESSPRHVRGAIMVSVLLRPWLWLTPGNGSFETDSDLASSPSAPTPAYSSPMRLNTAHTRSCHLRPGWFPSESP
jgi:hypothetical protein